MDYLAALSLGAYPAPGTTLAGRAIFGLSWGLLGTAPQAGGGTFWRFWRVLKGI